MTRRDQILQRLLSSVAEYHAAFGKPIGLNILSAKYSRSLSQLGGFPEAIDELHSKQLIQVSLRPTGGKDVWPANTLITISENDRLITKK